MVLPPFHICLMEFNIEVRNPDNSVQFPEKAQESRRCCCAVLAAFFGAQGVAGANMYQAGVGVLASALDS